jgi:hypothetical protein
MESKKIVTLPHVKPESFLCPECSTEYTLVEDATYITCRQCRNTFHMAGLRAHRFVVPCAPSPLARAFSLALDRAMQEGPKAVRILQGTASAAAKVATDASGELLCVLSIAEHYVRQAEREDALLEDAGIEAWERATQGVSIYEQSLGAA